MIGGGQRQPFYFVELFFSYIRPPSFFRSTCHDGSVGDSEAFQQGVTASKDVGSVEMDGSAVGAAVVDGCGGGSGEG
jgi:hypothetical protein